MRLPSFKRLTSSDFPESFRPILETLAESLNIGIDVLYQALNNNLTRRDNMLATEKDVVITTNDQGQPTTTTSFTVTFPGKATGVVIEKIENLTNANALLVGGVTLLWSQTGTTVVINQVTGLIPSNTYRLRMVAYG